MQSSSVYLYPNKINAYTLDSAWSTERNRIVYNRNLKIYRSTDNRIDLQILGADQKSKNTAGTVLVFNLISNETKKLILHKDCLVDDETIGRLYVIITEAEMRNLEEGFYSFSIIQETRELVNESSYVVKSKVPLYFDSQYEAIGVIEVAGNLLGSVESSIIIDTFSRIVDFDSPINNPAGETPPFSLPRPNYAQNAYTSRYSEYYLSNIIDGQPNINTASSFHTFQFYFSNYEGEVTIQGSINPGSTPAAGDWVDIETVDPTTEKYKNVVGKWNWFRIKHTPSENNTGKVDKILYR